MDFIPPRSLWTVIQSLIGQGHTISLSARDVALLILIYDELERTDESSATVSMELLHTLHAILDSLDPRESHSAERRLNESLHRLYESNCLARVDLQRLHRAAQAEYHLTAIGEALAEWHIAESRFSSEPLTAIFRTFISELTLLAEIAAGAPSNQWNVTILQPLQYALKGMLIAIQHHQKELDRRHEDLRRFFSTLLTQGTEDSIQQCEQQLTRVIKTIADLQEVVLASANTADTLIARVSAQAPEDVRIMSDVICDDLTRRLQHISQWTARRAVEWVDHHHIVHNFLRTVVRVDRQRRVTEALKRAVAAEPTWTLEMPASSTFIRMRDAIREPVTKVPPRISKGELSRPREVDEVQPDQVPALLQRYLADDLARHEAFASAILRRAMQEQEIQSSALIRHFPWLLGEMAEAGTLDVARRDWVPITGTIEIEEVRVTDP